MGGPTSRPAVRLVTFADLIPDQVCQLTGYHNPDREELWWRAPNDDLGNVVEQVLDQHRSALRELTLP